MAEQVITFPQFTGLRCLMMPYIQGEPDSVPAQFRVGYEEILKTVLFEKGKIGFLTIDESPAVKGLPHRGARAKWGRALHTEAGRRPHKIYAWGSPPVYAWGDPPTREPDLGWGSPQPLGWGSYHQVTLDRDVRVLLANSVDRTCALWDVEHEDTSVDGDIGNFAADYPYSEALFMQPGQVREIGILTPHESMPVPRNVNRQFLRIISSGVHGREPYFTINPLF